MRPACLCWRVLAAGIVLADGDDAWVYPFGMLATDAVMVASSPPSSSSRGPPVARLLALAPLRGVGKISYGLYLWHFPLFLWLDESSTGLHGAALLVLRLGVTLAVSLLSYVVIEQPIRQRRRPAWVVRGLAPVGAGAAVVSLLMASAASSLPVGVPAAAKLPKAPARLAGTDGPCAGQPLGLGSRLGMTPVGTDKVAKFEYAALGKSDLVWSGSATKTFTDVPAQARARRRRLAGLHAGAADDG